MSLMEIPVEMHTDSLTDQTDQNSIR